MTATITTALRRLLLDSFFNDVQDSAERYYIGIGRSEQWDSADAAPVPNQTDRDARLFRHSMQSIKSAESVSYVVPRYSWASGTVYNAWNDDVGEHEERYYVITDAQQVYVCLQGGRDATGSAVASTIEPTSTAVTPFKTSDGYVWKFLYTLTAVNSAAYLTANYFPVTRVTITDSDSPAQLIQQQSVQNVARPKEIIGFEVLSGGTGYTTSPTVTIIGDGDSCQANARIGGGAVIQVRIDSDAGTFLYGTGYNQATVSITGGGGSGAVVRPIYGPPLGMGADPRTDLKSNALMFNTKPSGTETGDFIINNDFRQVALIRSPRKLNDSDFTGGTGLVLRSLVLSSTAVAFTEDKTIQGATSSARAVIDYVDSDTLFVHQNETTGFRSFAASEAVSEINGSGAGVIAAIAVDSDGDGLISGDVNRFSGDILYIDNRAPIDRAADQTEDIKVIIKL